MNFYFCTRFVFSYSIFQLDYYQFITTNLYLSSRFCLQLEHFLIDHFFNRSFFKSIIFDSQPLPGSLCTKYFLELVVYGAEKGKLTNEVGGGRVKREGGGGGIMRRG